MKELKMSFLFSILLILLVPASSLLIRHTGSTRRGGIRYELIKVINDGPKITNITILLDGREYTKIPLLPANQRIKEEIHLPPGNYQLEVISGDLKDNITVFVPREKIETPKIREEEKQKPSPGPNLLYILIPILVVAGIIAYFFYRYSKK